ncbi:MAG TPA: NAD(P)H-hydrate dehydratase, partial [Ramlibacter sp.]|nr:NAD(P)H-hydrate dehydratase [Ramlibacter sp.]
SREMPGAAVLAATAALRCGAGKLVVATAASVAGPMGFALPEARVIALPETPGGGLAMQGLEQLESSLRDAAAVLVGPGLMDAEATQRFVLALLALAKTVPVVLDALAMDVLALRPRFEQPVLLTPHAGEMAHLSGASKQDVLADPHAAALAGAARWNAVVAVKGPMTVIAAPDGQCWRHEGGNNGLATSGSGDTLAGAIAGLAARGATLAQACAWGVAVHALAGEHLAMDLGPVGFLARELPGSMLAALSVLQA